MPSDQVARPWAIRSTLVVVADLDRSVAFYRELGPFGEIAREDAAAVLGDATPASFILILREAGGVHNVRYGRQSLGLRSLTFNVGSLSALDRIESVLRGRDRFTSRHHDADGATDFLSGRDPDNLPLVFACYDENQPLGPDYYRNIFNMAYSLDA